MRGLGGATLLTLIGGAARAYDQGVFSAGQGSAYEPWRNNDPSGPVSLVDAAILAATPHNTQAWRFRSTATHVDVFDDTRRSLGAVDPFRREMHLALGAALENLVLSARAQGYAPDVTLLPVSGERTHVARVALTGGTRHAADLQAVIRGRHTNRSPYQDRGVPPAALKAMSALNDEADVRLIWLTEQAARRALAELTVRATQAFVTDTEMTHDSDRWFRHDWDVLQRERDGLTLDAQSLPPLLTVMGKMLPAPSPNTSNTYWLRNTRTQVATAPAFGIIAVRDHRAVVARLRAGRLYQRLALWATREGLATHPLNQAVELRDRDLVLRRAPQYARALSDLTGQAWQAVMPFRVGYPTVPSQPSPRRSVQTVLVV